MSIKLENAPAETASDRLGRHLDLLQRLGEVLQEERTDLAAVCQAMIACSAPSGSTDEAIVQLHSENNRLHQLIRELEDQLTSNMERTSEAAGSLEDENAQLRKQLQEKEATVEELRARCLHAEADPANRDIVDYEAELNEFRRELESDRQKMDAELKHLRARNQELKEASREAELEMSRDRAQLARERSQLERMREEFRHETERALRNAGVQERLASVSKLKEEISDRNRALAQAVPAAENGERALGGRWRDFLKR